MIKFILGTITAFALTGCYQRVDQYDIQRASAYCGGVDKIVHISSHFDGDESARCINKPGKLLRNEETFK